MRLSQLILAISLIAIALAGFAYRYAYPPKVMERATARMIVDFGRAVESKDRAKIGAFLQDMLSDNAKIQLQISFHTLGNPAGSAAVVQDFTKASFIPFIDNVLFPLTDYAYRAKLQDFALFADRSVADIRFTSSDWAEGPSYFQGLAIGMRYTSTSECTGSVGFTEKKQPTITNVVCKIDLRMLPKAEESEKLRNPAIIREMLGNP